MSQINDLNIALNNLIDKIKICLSKAEYTKKTNKTKIMKPRKDWVAKASMISSKKKTIKYGKKILIIVEKEKNIRNL